MSDDKRRMRRHADDAHERTCCDEHADHNCDLDGYTKLCWVCQRLIARTLATLAHNIAWGASLCASFTDGWYQGMDYQRAMQRGRENFDLAGRWRPGCGWSIV